MKTPETSKTFLARTPEDLYDVARNVVEMGHRVILLHGELGAGKTTFVKTFCSVLGSADEVTSPTFTLVNEYRDISGTPIFHIDLYRLESIEDVIPIGIEDYLYSGAWCLIEWPELIHSLAASQDYLKVFIEANPDDSRRIVTLK